MSLSATGKLGLRLCPDKIFYRVHNRLQVPRVGARYRHAQHGYLDVVLPVDLGDGGVETIVQPVFEALDHTALVLEGCGPAV